MSWPFTTRVAADLRHASSPAPPSASKASEPGSGTSPAVSDSPAVL